jgi:hypothetical protein
MRRLKSEKSEAREVEAIKPFYFLSFSTGEPQIKLFGECLEIVFKEYFDLRRTPASLTTGKSQHEAILDSISKCRFGVVCLDGLRPNVVYEYGAMRGAGRPILIFKEESARVDIGHFYGSIAGLGVPPPAIDLDKHFSNTKDLFCKSWNRFEIEKTIKTIWEAYSEAIQRMDGFPDIPRPEL